jgi:hypothetical protein
LAHGLEKFYEAGSLLVVTKEVSKCKLDLVGVQVRLEGIDTEL